MDVPPDKHSATRREALQKALERCVPSADAPEDARRRRAAFEARRISEHDLIDEISSAARRIAAARDWNGDPVYRTDGVWRVLATVASSPYCLAIADVGRALRIRKQSARELAHEAVRAGVIELVPNPQDKRLLQALVTPRGRAELAAARTAEEILLSRLLSGLGDHELKVALRVVRVIRQRLERDARELERQKAERVRRNAEVARRNAFLP